MKKLQDKLKVTGAAFQTVGAGMAGVGIGLMAALVPAITAASRLEETMNKFNVVFGNNSNAVKAWGDNFADQVGRSKQDVADFLASTQDLFVPLGFDAASAEVFSKKLVSLTVDVASFNNKVDADVLRDFHAALTGGGETVKKYGVLLNVVTTNADLLAMGLNPKAATEQEKVQARLNILMKATTAAQGDAIRSAGSFANQMKRLKGKLDDTAASIGSALLPVITPLVKNFGSALKIIAKWAAANRTFVATFAKVAGVITAVGVTLIALGLAMKGVAIAQATILSLGGPAGWAVLAISVGVATGAAIALSGIMDDAAKSAGTAAKEIDVAASAVDGFAKKAKDAETAYSPLLATLDNLTERMRKLAAGERNTKVLISQGAGFSVSPASERREKRSLTGDVLDELSKLRKLAAAADGPVNTLRRSLADVKQAAAEGVLPDGLADTIETFLSGEIGKETGLTKALRAANEELNLMSGSVSKIDIAVKKFVNGAGTIGEGGLLRDALEKVEAAKKAAEAAKQEKFRLDAIAASATEETRTPEERFRKRVDELQSVRSDIGEETFAKAFNQAGINSGMFVRRQPRQGWRSLRRVGSEGRFLGHNGPETIVRIRRG